MGEDGEEDAVHGGSILEDAHGPGPSPHFSESPFDGVGGAHPLAFVEGRIAPAGEQFVEVVPQAIDGFGVGVVPTVREAAGGGPCLGDGLGVHDGVQTGFGGLAVSLFDLAEDVSDLVRPAALNGDAGIDHRQGGQEARAAVDADHLEPRAFETAAEEIGQEQLPLSRALGHRQAVIDDLLFAIGPQAQGHQDGAAERAHAGLAGQHHAVEHQDR